MTSILTIIQQQDDEYDRLHALYEEAKQCVDSAPTPEELEAATTAFHPIQQEFLRNRERATPTECYQMIASYLDRLSRTRLAQCDKHLYYQVIYGKYSGRFVWSEGKERVLEHAYRRTFKVDPYQLTMTPLLHASRDGTARVVRVLIDAKADLEAGDSWYHHTPLHHACKQGHDDVAGLLIDAGADVNALATGDSALLFTAEADNLPMVRRLLTAGANPNNGSKRPLEAAAVNNNSELVRILLDANADVYHTHMFGFTALHNAASAKSSVDVLSILITVGGTNVNHTSTDGFTPLACACRGDRIDAVIALLAANADPNIVNNWGESPLMYACRKGNVEIVRTLLAAAANVKWCNDDGWTPLRLAKQKRNDEVIALLLAAGAAV